MKGFQNSSETQKASLNLFVVKYLNACFKAIYIFFFKRNLFSSNQSGLGPGYSCINQLLSINHVILSAFDMGIEVCGIFLIFLKLLKKYDMME